MSKFREYRNALTIAVEKYLAEMDEADKIKKAQLIREFIDDFQEIFFWGEKYDDKDMAIIKREGDSIYNLYIVY